MLTPAKIIDSYFLMVSFALILIPSIGFLFSGIPALLKYSHDPNLSFLTLEQKGFALALQVHCTLPSSPYPSSRVWAPQRRAQPSTSHRYPTLPPFWFYLRLPNFLFNSVHCALGRASEGVGRSWGNAAGGPLNLGTAPIGQSIRVTWTEGQERFPPPTC